MEKGMEALLLAPPSAPPTFVSSSLLHFFFFFFFFSPSYFSFFPNQWVEAPPLWRRDGGLVIGGRDEGPKPFPLALGWGLLSLWERRPPPPPLFLLPLYISSSPLLVLLPISLSFQPMGRGPSLMKGGMEALSLEEGMKALSLSFLHWDKVSSPFGKGGALSLSSFFISSSPPFPLHWDRVSSLLGKEGLRPNPLASPLLPVFFLFLFSTLFPYPNVRKRRRRRDEEEEREEREEGGGAREYEGHASLSWRVSSHLIFMRLRFLEGIIGTRGVTDILVEPSCLSPPSLSSFFSSSLLTLSQCKEKEEEKRWRREEGRNGRVWPQPFFLAQVASMERIQSPEKNHHRAMRSTCRKA